MLKHLLSLFVLAVCMQSVVCAQGASPGNSSTVYPTVQAKKYKILFITRDPMVARSLDSLVGNTLYITNKKGSQAVSIEVISKLKVARKKRPILRSMAFGTLAGIPVGAIVGLASYKETDFFGPGFNAAGGALAGCLAGFPVGAIVGAFSTRYTNYDFIGVPPTDKAASIARIMLGQQQ